VGVMQHGGPPIHVLVTIALVVGLSIAGGPLVWAMLVMLSPLLLLPLMVRGAGSHKHDPR
jgi:hypothetical protein